MLTSFGLSQIKFMSKRDSESFPKLKRGIQKLKKFDNRNVSQIEVEIKDMFLQLITKQENK